MFWVIWTTDKAKSYVYLFLNNIFNGSFSLMYYKIPSAFLWQSRQKEVWKPFIKADLLRHIHQVWFFKNQDVYISLDLTSYIIVLVIY